MFAFETREGLVEETEYIYENNDVQLLYLLCQFVQHGPNSKYRELLCKHLKTPICKMNGLVWWVLYRAPGLVSLARWITMASNILFLYIISNPIEYGEGWESLVSLVDIIIRFYAVMIFKTKQNSHVSNGSRLFFEGYMLSKAILKDEVWEAAESAWMRNGFWFAFESIILAMSMDDDLQKRKIAAEEIKEAWRRRVDCLKRNPNPYVRKFEFYPQLFDSEASDYSKMIPLERLSPRQKTVPPLIIGLIKELGIEEVVSLTINGTLPILEVACHSQG